MERGRVAGYGKCNLPITAMVGIILSQLVSREDEIPNTVRGSFLFLSRTRPLMESAQPPRSKRVAVSGPPLSPDELKDQHGIKAIDYAYHSKLAPVPALIHRQAQPSIENVDSSQPKQRPLQRVPTEVIDENSQQSSQGYNNSRLLARNPNPLERSPNRARYLATTAQTATAGPSSAAALPPSAGQVARPQHASPYSPLRYTPDLPTETTGLDRRRNANEAIHMDIDNDVRSTTPTPFPRLPTSHTSPLSAPAKASAIVPTPPSTPPLPPKQASPISRNNSLTKRPSLTSGSRSLIRRSSSSHLLTGHPPRYYLRKRKTPATATPIVASSSQEAKPKPRSRTRSILRGGILKGRSKKKATKS